MRKFTFILGAILAGVFLVQFEAGEISTTDIVSYLDSDRSEKNHEIIERSQKFFDEILELPHGFFEHFDFGSLEFSNFIHGSHRQNIRAAILPSDDSFSGAVDEFFGKLKNTREISRVIVMTQNHKLKGRFNIVLSKYGYDFGGTKVFPDTKAVNSLLINQNSMGVNIWPFFHDREIAKIAFVANRHFPDAKILPITIKEFATDFELELLARGLAEICDEETIVVVPNKFSEGVFGRVKAFHDEFNMDIIKNSDGGRSALLHAESITNMRALFAFLEYAGFFVSGFERNFNAEGQDSFIATFSDGGARRSDSSPVILAFGDMMLGRYVRTLMDAHGQDYIFENIRGEKNAFFKGADIIFGNLEGPIKGDGFKSATSMVFGFPEYVAPLLKKYGFTLLMIANNHAVDQGWSGRDSTISALTDAGISWCGHPSEVSEESVFFQNIGEKKIAFICFHDVSFKLNDAEAVSLVEKIAAQTDFLVVSAHFGYEYKHQADRQTQIEPARAWIDAGADFVIGHHPHVVQNFEVYNGKFIFYSLGNFVFDQYWSKATQEQLAIGIVLNEKNTRVYLFPMKSEKSQPRLMTSNEYSEWIERFISYGDYSEEQKAQIRNGIVESNL